MEKNKVRYVSSAPAQVAGRYYKPGEVFETDAPKADDWTEVDPAPKSPRAAARAKS